MRVHLPSGVPDQTKQRAGTANRVLVAIATLVVAATAYWAFRHSPKSTGPPIGQDGAGVLLSEGTTKVLSALRSPLELRFYAVLDPATTSEALRSLANRIDGLLSAYEAAAPDKVRITRFNSESAAAASKAASADGLKPFNLDKGDACYLGIVVEYEGRKEVLAHLAPEWEPALESDLSRAIERVSTTTEAGTTVANVSQLDRVAKEEVQRIIPNVQAVSLDEGRQMLREAALKDLQSVVSEMEAQVRDAQQRLTEAQKSNSEAEQKAAMKNLQDLQLQMGQKLKEVGERSQAQIKAFEQMKSGAQ